MGISNFSKPHSLEMLGSQDLSILPNGSLSSDLGASSQQNSAQTGTTSADLRAGSSLLSSSSFLESPTLGDTTDKILPTEQTLAHQKFSNPQTPSSFFGNETTSGLSTGTDGSEALLGRGSTASLSNRLFAAPALAPITSSLPTRASSANSVFDGSRSVTSLNLSQTSADLDTTLQPNLSLDSFSSSAAPEGLLNMY